MFGLSSVEFGFCVLVALLVVGPSDLPVLIRQIGGLARRGRRLYSEAIGAFRRLETEVDKLEQPDETVTWQDFLPPEVKELRRSITPHADKTETAEKYRLVRDGIAKAKSDYRDHLGATRGDTAA